MKITMHKKGMTRMCQDYEQAQLESAGWSQCQHTGSDHTEQVREEVIRLRPPVKTKATVTAEEEANINIQGDE
jgi:hypothetical protein